MWDHAAFSCWVTRNWLIQCLLRLILASLNSKCVAQDPGEPLAFRTCLFTHAETLSSMYLVDPSTLETIEKASAKSITRWLELMATLNHSKTWVLHGMPAPCFPPGSLAQSCCLERTVANLLSAHCPTADSLTVLMRLVLTKCRSSSVTSFQETSPPPTQSCCVTAAHSSTSHVPFQLVASTYTSK